jgi:poly(beta-D-mannuronate) lyase
MKEWRPGASAILWAVVGALVFGAGELHSATYRVGSLSELTARINAASVGDEIIVADGVYSTSAAIDVRCAGTATNRIIIRAATIGGVEISGSHGFNLNPGAAHVTIQGFKFTHRSGGAAIQSGANFIRFTRNIFQCTGAGHFLLVAGDDAEIDHNEFRDKSTVGNMIDVRGTDGQVARRVWVHHNYFHDFTSAGANGAETIRWGLSGLSLSTGSGLCEYNLFVRCNGENEMISNKSSGNTYRYNTVLNSREVSQRHGNDCFYYGNIIRNSGGIRVYGDRHKLFSNYLEGNSIGVNLGNGGGDVYAGALLTAHDRPDDNVVAFNTFINNRTHYQMGVRSGGLGSSNTVVANNLFSGGGVAVTVSRGQPYTGTWLNNILWQTRGAGDLPATGYQTTEPLLTPDANGIYRLQPDSPAGNAGRGARDAYDHWLRFEFVNVDQDGQPRDAAPDVGADEISRAPIRARLLTTNDVGPFARSP